MNRIALCIVGLALASRAQAAPITWSGSQGSLAASATFDVAGSDLVVTLTNTSSADVLIPADILSGVYFSISGGPLSLTRVSAVVPAGSSVLFGPMEAGGGVGGEWAFRSDLSGGPLSMSYGISSTGLGFFGSGDLFPGVNLEGPIAPNGLNYGITSAGDNPSTGNTPVTGTEPLIKNQVVFHLGGLPAGFDPATRITSAGFQYGTATDEPSFPAVPAPGTAGVLGAAALVAIRRRRPR